jgi:hypothetical protein
MAASEVVDPRAAAAARGRPPAKPVQQSSQSASAAAPGAGGGAKSKVERYRYPLDVLNSSSDYFMLQAVKYTAPGVGLAGQSQALSEVIGASPGSNQPQLSDAGNNLRPPTSDGQLRKTEKENTLAYYILPMPPQIGTNNQVGWDKGEINAAGSAIAALGQELMKSSSGSPVPTFEGFGQAFNKVRNFGSMLTGQAGAGGGLMGDYLTSLMINLIPGNQVSPSDIFARNRGIVINPNMEFLFKGPNLRQFRFTFLLIARNKKESDHIRDMVRSLKKHMSPKKTIDTFGDNQLFGAFLQTPDVFKLSYMKGTSGHPYLNTFKYCAMTGISVNFAEGMTYMSYDDGAPVAVGLSMDFTELTPIYAEDYDSDYAGGGVGF